MKIIFNKKKLINFIKNQKNLGFVPTMGGIHAGHISLINRSVKECEKTIVTIFVNKPQFNKKSDYIKYPRTNKKDILSLRKAKVDFLYIPKNRDIYNLKRNKKIKINPFSKQLCGRFRPNHFYAVVDVLDRFIKIIKPKKIFMGEKDMQQLKIVKHFVTNNFKNINIIECETVREKNGTALSSRNKLLSIKGSSISSQVYKLIYNNKKKILKNKINLNTIKKQIYKIGVSKIDYIKILDINKIIKPYIRSNKYKIFVAYYIGSVRLIDNI